VSDFGWLRERFLKTVLELMGKPYKWAGKDSSGLDCSGLVTFGLFLASSGRIDWRQSHNTDRLWAELEPTDNPAPGDLAFYGPNKANPNDVAHVMVCLAGGFVFGAAGGDSSTTSPEIAKVQDARVKVKTSVNYRPDFRGFRRLPEFQPDGRA
jgi:cell wall-associated NlpC family hydrolase